MSLDSLSSPEILTPNIENKPQPSQPHSHSHHRSHYTQSCASYLSGSDSQHTASPSSRSDFGSGIDWSSFNEQKRRAEERWRKRRLIKAQKDEWDASHATESIAGSSLMLGRMNALRMTETYTDITAPIHCQISNELPPADLDLDQPLSETKDTTAISTHVPSHDVTATPPSEDLDVEIDDDDAFLRQLMARAEQAQKENTRAAKGLDTSTTHRPRSISPPPFVGQSSAQNDGGMSDDQFRQEKKR